MIICAGEILADLIGKEENGRVLYEWFAGGAPFNVACGLKERGARRGFCARLRTQGWADSLLWREFPRASAARSI